MKLSRKLQALVNESVAVTSQALDSLTVPRVAQWSESAASIAGDVASAAGADLSSLGMQVGEVLTQYPVLNPMPGVPGGSVTNCITIMETRGNVRDPGALCASIARKRGEVIPRRKKSSKKKSVRSLVHKALK